MKSPPPILARLLRKSRSTPRLPNATTCSFTLAKRLRLRNHPSSSGLDVISHHEGAEERFRCSVFHAGDGLHAAIRRVNPKVPDFQELNMPPIYQKMTEDTHEGLVIVCDKQEKVFHGNIDDVRLYGYALSDGEISGLVP